MSYSHQVHVSHYLIEGGDARQLKASMLERGPLAEGNKRYFAYTLWRIKRGNFSEILPKKFKRGKDLTCYVSVHLPFWKPTSKELDDNWRRFQRNTIYHESQHVRHIIRACRQIKSKNFANPQLQAIAKRVKVRDLDYDRVTEHGILTGVVLE